MSTGIRTGSLVLYKIHPALVGQTADKIEITLPDGKSKRVREKDVMLLHPGPLSSLGALEPPSANLEEAWELLQGEQTTLPELAELVYGEFSPAAAWAAWQLLQDGMYFQGQPDAISVRSEQEIAAEQAERERKEREQQDWDEFIGRVTRGKLQDEDRKRLAEVERVALGASEHSRILTTLQIDQTTEAAHRFLIRCGYWGREHNPWPARIGALFEPVEAEVPPLPEEQRLDLRHLSAWAIDDEGNQDPDDAISVDGDRLWVHVADVAALAPADSELDLAARARGSNLYLPETIQTMLPEAVTERLGLGLHEESPALSFGFRFDGEQVTDIEIAPSRVRVTRTTYQRAAEDIPAEILTAMSTITATYRAARVARNAARIDLPEASVRVVDGDIRIRPMQRLGSRDMVTDAMLMAGEAAARFCAANAVAIPFVAQPEPEEIRQPATMSAMFAYRRLFKPSVTALHPEPHFGLGLPIYARATSPLRRYADLVVHQQLRLFVGAGEPADQEAIATRIAGLDSASRLIRRAERLSNQHWKLAYLARNPNWQGDAVVVALEERKAVVVIPELAMEAKIRLHDTYALDQGLRIAVREVDLPAQTVYFGVL